MRRGGVCVCVCEMAGDCAFLMWVCVCLCYVKGGGGVVLVEVVCVVLSVFCS